MKTHHETHYGTAPHHLLYDENLSLKAKGLYTYMQAKPDGWSFSAKRIALETKDGKDAIQAALNELIDAGWLVREQTKDDNGRWVWSHLLRATKQEIIPVAENPVQEKPANNKERDTKKERTYVADATEPPFDVDDYISRQMLHDARRHIRVIGIFLQLKREKYNQPNITTTDEMSATIARFSRPATEVAKFTSDKIKTAFDKAFERCGDETTVETVYKYLTK